MTLKELGIGQKGIILSVGGSGALRQHFLDMGLIRGAEVTVVKYAPMGDPIELKIHGYELTIRLDDAEKIEVKEIKSEEGFVNIGGWISENINDLDAFIYSDPNKPEYIGLVPNGEEYEPEEPKLFSTKISKKSQNNERLVLDFLSILNDLSDDDLKRVIIPTDILVRLMK